MSGSGHVAASLGNGAGEEAEAGRAGRESWERGELGLAPA